MIAAVVTFENVGSLSLEEATAKFQSTAPNYRGREGLISKSYIFSDDGTILGGIYIWESREAAEEMYGGSWESTVTGVYGVPPTLQYFEVPVYINNL